MSIKNILFSIILAAAVILINTNTNAGLPLITRIVFSVLAVGSIVILLTQKKDEQKK